MSTLEIYDLQLDDLADLVGDFEASTHTGVENWIAAQWRRSANVLGFRESFDRLTRGRRRSRDYSASAVGLRAFYAYLTRIDGATVPDQARIRHQCLTALRRIDPANLWITDIDSRRLPESACFDVPGQVVREPTGPIERLLYANATAPRVQVMPRKPVFKSDVSASYFFPREERDPAGKPRDTGPCIYRVRLSLGTFPFVYGDNLADPTGLYWYSQKDWRPALEAMRIASRFWTQDNLAQDARTVVQQYKHFRTTTAKALNRKMPGARDARTGLLRPVNRRERAATPRGPIHVNAYNAVLYSFAAFFAARRAYLRAPRALSPETWRAVKANPDPILHEQLGIKKRAM